MANTTYRLDPFHQWSPFQAKAQPLRHPPNIGRYPSPVSMAATPPPSISSDVNLKSARKAHSLNSGQHPLPARPPVEVCVDAGPTSVSEYPSLDPVASGSLDQTPVSSSFGDQIQPHEDCGDENIDPAILCGEDYTYSEQSRRPENEQDAEVTKPPSSGTKRDRTISSRCSSPKIRRHTKSRFSSIRSQFMALPVGDRLQFLSWLFEGALSNCVSVPPSPIADSPLNHRPEIDAESANGGDQSPITEAADVQDTASTRRGLPWSLEESRLLVKLREDERLAWSDVVRRFTRKFPGRSKGSIQVYWSTTLKKKRSCLRFHSD